MVKETTFKKLPSFDPDTLEQETPDYPEFDAEDLDDDWEDDEEDVQDEVPEDADPSEIKILDFDDILDVDDTNEEPFFVKEWGGHVVIKGVTKSEFDHLRRMSGGKQTRSSGNRNAVIERELLIAGMVKPKIDVARYNVLLERSAGAIIRITEKILEKSGLADKAEDRREQRFPRKR